MCEYKTNDGGMLEYFPGNDIGDSIIRAISIATGKDCKQVYDIMLDGMRKMNKRRSPRSGINKQVYHNYLIENGFEWYQSSIYSEGYTMHLHKDELPGGILIVSLTKHFSCVINGVINDSIDPRRGAGNITKRGVQLYHPERRRVHGYYKKM